MKLASGRKSWEGIKSLLIQSLWVVGGKPAGGEGSDLTIKMRIPGVYKKSRANALCGYPLVKMELEIQTRFLPRLPFSCNSIISDKIWRKMSLSLSIFLVLPQISLVKYYETIKILMQIF